MHLEFHPADAPDPNDPDVRFNVPAETITTELLEICDEFFRQASPIVHTELRHFLTEHGHHDGLGWFLDALGLTTPNSTTVANVLSGATPVGGRAADTSVGSPVPH